MNFGNVPNHVVNGGGFGNPGNNPGNNPGHNPENNPGHNPGNNPMVMDIDQETEKNEYYRRVIYRSKFIEVTLMSIPPNRTIPLEMHNGDQFIRIENGTGVVTINGMMYRIYDGIAIVIPAGNQHLIENTGTLALKLYTIYSPPQHSENTIQQMDEQGNLYDVV